ncbi:MAG: NusG domain II-containing protein [Desulfobacterales bacterium]|nr:NusG domain II-containing protein [Desulfobacterales bacterium]
MPIAATRFRIELNKMTVLDIVLICAVLFLSTNIIVKTKLLRASPPAISAEAIVYCDGREQQRIDLRKDMDIVLPGKKMVIAVEGGKIRIKQSDCHRQMCVHAGWVRLAGETIVCVPNRIVIEVAAGAVPVVDAVVF